MTEQQAEIDLLFEDAARLAVRTLREQQDRSQPVVHWLEPEELTRALELDLPVEGRGLDSVMELARKTLHFSVRKRSWASGLQRSAIRPCTPIRPLLWVRW